MLIGALISGTQEPGHAAPPVASVPIGALISGIQEPGHAAPPVASVPIGALISGTQEPGHTAPPVASVLIGALISGTQEPGHAAPPAIQPDACAFHAFPFPDGAPPNAWSNDLRSIDRPERREDAKCACKKREERPSPLRFSPE